MSYQYRNENQAVARAVNSGEGRPKPAQWQEQYTAGYRESHNGLDECDYLEGIDRLLADTMTHARIKMSISATHFNVLVVKHSGNEKDRIQALAALVPEMGTPAGPNCKALAIGAWASKSYESNASVNWDQQDVSDRTLRHWRKEITIQLRDLYSAALLAVRERLKADGLIGE